MSARMMIFRRERCDVFAIIAVTAGYDYRMNIAASALGHAYEGASGRVKAQSERAECAPIKRYRARRKHARERRVG